VTTQLRAFTTVFAVLVAGFVISWYLRLTVAGPTPAEYVAVKSTATIIEPGKLVVDGETFRCAHYPTVLNPAFPEYGAAYFGFILLNPERFATLPRSLQRFAFAHECGHQYVGYSEVAADCYSVRRGLADKWLDATSLEEICAFFTKSKGTAFHLPGPQRCAAIRACYSRFKMR